MKIAISIFCIAFLIACGDEEPAIIPTPEVIEVEPEFPTNINSELQVYIDDFIAEGSKRGITRLSANNLTAIFVNTLVEGGESFCGYGWSNYNGTGAPRVHIKNSDQCWNSRTEIERENFMFHELGHALLARQHSSKLFPNGYPGSIMCTNANEGFCNNYYVYYETLEMRDYYLDELFDKFAPEPEWINTKIVTQEIHNETIGNSLQNWDQYRFPLTDSLNLSEFSFYIDSSGTFPDNSLAISVKNNPQEGTSAAVFRRIPLVDIPNCATLRVSADIKAFGLEDGKITVGLSLREISENGDTLVFGNFNKDLENLIDGSLTEFETELYCIPSKSQIASLGIQMIPKQPASVYIDNLSFSLLE